MSSKVPTKRIYCGHCESWLVRSTFYRHKRNYFDTKNQEWITRDMTRKARKNFHHLETVLDEFGPVDHVTANEDSESRDLLNGRYGEIDLDRIISDKGKN